MDELKSIETELLADIINWGRDNDYVIDFNADSNIKQYQSVEINFSAKKIKIS